VSPEPGSRLRRLLALGPAGVARRLRQRAAGPGRRRRQAQWRARFAGSDGPASPLSPGPVAAAPFFFDPRARGRQAEFAARFPGAERRLLEQAEATLRGDLSWVGPYAVPDWHAASPAGGRWPLAPPETLAVGDARPLGDVRLGWEVGRCTHLVRLAQAAWLTGERRFAEAAAAGLRDFAGSNPCGLGIAWLQAQEVALRAVAWLWVFHLLEAVGGLDAPTFALWARQMEAHAAFVDAHLCDSPVTHNHLVSEAAALAILGLALPGLPEAPRWARRGLRVLWREVGKQIDGEGLSGEHALHYHAFVLDSCLAALLLARRAGRPVPEAVATTIEAMAVAVARLVRADGTLPSIGDSDAGRACRLGLDPLDRRDALAAAAVAFDRPDLGAAAGDAPGAFWLTGGAEVPGASGPPPSGGA
jgi:Heparinase II/III N-terminus